VGKSATYENALLLLLFNATTWANIAINATSSPLTSLYVGLHTADPNVTAGSGTVGTQNASEISYTGYARVAVARTSSGWTVSGGSCSPVSAITFGAMTAGAGGTASYWSIGAASSGASVLYYSGSISPTISVTTGVTPQLTTASAVTES
jgi:hypothetical protein